jgi:hypothetical protein
VRGKCPIEKVEMGETERTGRVRLPPAAVNEIIILLLVYIA